MELLRPDSTTSSAFVIPFGKQVTLYAKGLTGTDKVVVEILEISSAPDSTGNPCCDIQKAQIEVARRTPLLCPNGTAVELTAEYPWGVLDTPQNVPLGVRLIADPAAVVSVELHETDADSCMTCICSKPCVDSTWSATGEIRCTGTRIEAKEVSNCGTTRWTDTGPQVWEPTGETRCRDNKVENEEVTPCGTTRWTATTAVCGFCPSIRMSCEGFPGYAFHDSDIRDPAATVSIDPCPDDNSFDRMWIYPTAGPGHTIKVRVCGELLGYASNCSDCACS